MSVNAWRGDHPLDGFESKSEHVTMSISAEQISTGPITRQVARLFLCGDVMTGRGIDQILPHPCDPLLHESYVKSARDYIRFAEQANGRIPRAVKFSYVWGYGSAGADPRAAGCTDHQSRNQHHAQRGVCAERHQLSNEPRERRLSCVCRYRLLCARQQPYFRLGACWAGRHRWKVWSVCGSSQREPGLRSIKRAHQPSWIFPEEVASWCFRSRW